MNESRRKFAEQLAASKPTDPGFRQSYEKELRDMLDQKLTADQKRSRWVAVVAALLMSGLMAWVGLESMRAFTPEFHLPAYIGVYMFLTSAAFLAAAAIFGATIWQGVHRRQTHGRTMAMVAVTYVGLTAWLFLLAARVTPELLRHDFLVFGLVLMVYGAIAWVRHRIGQAELNTREKLLEIELRLAKIAEALEAKGGAS